MELDALAALIRLLRQSGVYDYKCGDVEIRLGPEPLPPEPEARLNPDQRERYERDLALAHVQPMSDDWGA